MAQQQPDRLVDMQVIASSLGVSCTYCHAGRGAPPAVTASGKSRQEVAREMIAMTRALNATVQTAAGKPANETVPVGCITCHRGVPIPRQLTDVLWTTTLRQGGPAAATQYRELRTQFYGKQAYDFGEDTLITIASRIGQARPEDAITLMELNLEFFPRSVRSHVTLAIAQSRGDAPAAIATPEESARDRTRERRDQGPALPARAAGRAPEPLNRRPYRGGATATPTSFARSSAALVRPLSRASSTKALSSAARAASPFLTTNDCSTST